MNTKDAYKVYKETEKRLNAYNLLLATAFYDKSTIAPKKGNKERNAALSLISGDLFAIATEPAYVEAVKFLKKADIQGDQKREIDLAYKSLEDIIKFTKEETMAFELARMEAGDVWEKAKHDDDYASFEPHLQKLFEITIERSKKRAPKKNPYDVVLDDYEEGMTMKKYDEFFSLIKKELLPLIKEVNARQDKVDDSFLHRYYPRAKQEIFIKELLRYLNFDKGWSYMGVSEHPFTNGFSQNDVRITTAYDENNIAAAIFSVIHEVGHSYYEHQVKAKYQGTTIGSSISSGMHEGQSRFFENYLGRRKSFWVSLYPKLQKIFPENLKEVSLDEFVKAINASHSSLVRTEADELTYPIHILIRYEIEKAVFDGTLSTEGLNEVWKQKYHDYLGVDVPSDTDGILQDIHWSDANFGYFPTYALGSAIGAQLLNVVSKELDIDDALAHKKFKVVTDYLGQRVHQYGALYDYNTLLKMITGSTFKPKYYISYLKKKYSKLYEVK